MTFDSHLNHTFIKERHGIVTKAILKEVRKNKVVLQCPERQDRYTVPFKEFEKHYVLETTQ